MFNSRLSIYNPAPYYEWVDVGLTDEVPVSTNFSVADVRNISKKNAASSKTITIPATKEVNKLFQLIFEINIDLSIFNPNKKTQCEYFVGSESNFKGYLQLLNIKKKYEGNTLNVDYEVSIIGGGGDLFSAIGERFLTDLSFSDWNHVMQNSVRTLYPITLGEDICYPYIEYGITGAITNTWTIKHLKPAIFAREYVRRIFVQAGKTWTSVFLDGAIFRRYIIPSVIEGNLKRDPTLIANSQFNAGKNVNTTSNIAGTVFGSNWYIYNNNPSFAFANPAPFNIDSPAPFFDTGGVYNNGTYIFTPNYTGQYNITVRVDMDVLINAPIGTVTWNTLNGLGFGFQVQLLVNGSIVGTSFAQVLPDITVPQPFSCSINIPAQFLNSGQPVIVRLAKSDSFNLRTRFFDIGGFPISGPATSVDIRMLSTSTFSALLSTQDIEYGDQVLMNNTIPTLVKQRDFLGAIMQLFNLYMEVDKNNPNNFIIEPREDFINYTSPLDWTGKLDIKKEMEVKPMGDLDYKNLYFKYKSDGDEYNVSYEKARNETYSQKFLVVDNDFIKSDKTTEVIFAATPMVGNNFNDIVAGKLYKNDNGTVRPMACKIRILYWKGATTCRPYTLNNSGVPITNQTSYNFAGMMDDPYLPTLSLDWDIPKTLYWNFPSQAYTTNNLYNRGYSKLISEITDKNSKIVKCWINLNAVDIRQFSFRRIIYMDRTYYFVNNILNYNPTTSQSTQVELLNLKRGITFSPQSYPFVGEPIGVGYAVNPNINPNPNGGGVFGLNNVNFGNNILIVGNNNFIG